MSRDTHIRGTMTFNEDYTEATLVMRADDCSHLTLRDLKVILASTIKELELRETLHKIKIQGH